MPVSVTENAMTSEARLRLSFCGFHPDVAGSIASVTCPSCVNLKEFDSRFFRTCCRRFGSANIDFGSFGSRRMKKSTFLASATWRNVRST